MTSTTPGLNKNSEKISLPLWVQASIWMTAVITLLIIIVITSEYKYSRDSMIQSERTNAQTILSLEISSFNDYIKGLTAFAIQPCYDSQFTRYIETKKELTDAEISDIRDSMKAYYYTRSDINDYEIYFQNQNMMIGRDKSSQHMAVTKPAVLDDEFNLAAKECAASKYFLFITPSDKPGEIFNFYHSIIQLEKKATTALVRASVDDSYIRYLTKNHTANGEFILIYDSKGNLLYSGNPSLVDNDSHLLSTLTGSIETDSLGITEIDKESYIVSEVASELYGIHLISVKPEANLSSSLSALLKRCIAEALILWMSAVVAIFIVMRIATRHLSKLADELGNIGRGNFDTRISITGSSEIVDLKNAFNEMASKIQVLIRENYLVKLNEQSSKLIALEAQMNPHFLYNTLQAISTEALVNDQIQIHKMITSLASLLRYSIKGGDIVTLADETEHVKKYFYLQKTRLDDNLTYTISLDQNVLLCRVPKLCIQTLVENSIVHGISGNTTSINIDISIYAHNDRLIIIVTDNGCGMNHDTLSKLRLSFSSKDLNDRSESIGLKNLYNRLKIVYDDNATMDVDSALGRGTTTKLSLPIDRREL